MKLENANHWIADSSCFIVRKADNFVMGEDIFLGENDNIKNYKDKEYTEESYVKFYHDLNMLTPEEIIAKHQEEREKYALATNNKNE